jgi:hypothetical protein
MENEKIKKRDIKEKKCKEEAVWRLGTILIKSIKPQKESNSKKTYVWLEFSSALSYLMIKTYLLGLFKGNFPTQKHTDFRVWRQFSGDVDRNPSDGSTCERATWQRLGGRLDVMILFLVPWTSLRFPYLLDDDRYITTQLFTFLPILILRTIIYRFDTLIKTNPFKG